jgi:chromatin remodeling complex protein RSC6
MTMPKEAKPEKKASAFMRPVQISSELTAVVGPGPMPRTEVTKKLWDYIKKHDLQDKKNKRNIRPDEKLAKIFGSNKEISMFEMTRKVSQHIKQPAAAASHK